MFTFSFKKKLLNIFVNIVDSKMVDYKNSILNLLNSNNVTDDLLLEINNDLVSSYFNITTNLINNSNNIRAKFLWQSLPLNPTSCGYEIDYNNLSIAQLYAMTYYCFTNKVAEEKFCIFLSKYEHDAKQKILEELN